MPTTTTTTTTTPDTTVRPLGRHIANDGDQTMTTMRMMLDDDDDDDDEEKEEEDGGVTSWNGETSLYVAEAAEDVEDGLREFLMSARSQRSDGRNTG